MYLDVNFPVFIPFGFAVSWLIKILFFLFFYLREWERENERENMSWGRSRWIRRGRFPAEQGLSPWPWDHDLSWRQMLNWLSPPGASVRNLSRNWHSIIKFIWKFTHIRGKAIKLKTKTKTWGLRILDLMNYSYEAFFFFFLIFILFFSLFYFIFFLWGFNEENDG